MREKSFSFLSVGCTRSVFCLLLCREREGNGLNHGNTIINQTGMHLITTELFVNTQRPTHGFPIYKTLIDENPFVRSVFSSTICKFNSQILSDHAVNIWLYTIQVMTCLE